MSLTQIFPPSAIAQLWPINQSECTFIFRKDRNKNKINVELRAPGDKTRAKFSFDTLIDAGDYFNMVTKKLDGYYTNNDYKIADSYSGHLNAITQPCKENGDCTSDSVCVDFSSFRRESPYCFTLEKLSDPITLNPEW